MVAVEAVSLSGWFIQKEEQNIFAIENIRNRSMILKVVLVLNIHLFNLQYDSLYPPYMQYFNLFTIYICWSEPIYWSHIGYR